MNPEYYMILAMGLGGILFSLGGTGFKWARRYVLPFLLTGAVAIARGSDFMWWQYVGSFACLCGAFHLPYGERTPYPVKLLVGLTFSMPVMFFGFNWWILIVPVVWLAMFLLSNWRKTEKIFVWKIVEFITGVLIGCAYSIVIGGVA
jgi:hypothetical protein